MKRALLVLGLMMPCPAYATVASDLAAIELKLKACLLKDETSVGNDGCNSDALAAADKILTGVYRKEVDQLKHTSSGENSNDNKEMLARLIASERAWVAFKEADCKLQGITMLNGSGERMIIGGCLYRMTVDRVKSLNDLVTSR